MDNRDYKAMNKNENKETIDKQIVKIEGVVQKEDGKEFTKEEREKVYDSFVEWVEDNNFLFGGITI